MSGQGTFGSAASRWFGRAGTHDAIVGVHFGVRSAALVRLRPAGASGRPLLEFVQRVHADPTRRAELVRRWAHIGRLRDARVVVSLAAGEYDVHQVQAPPVPDDELREALRWQLREVLPYAPQDAALDFVRVPTGDDAPARASLLAITALKTNVSDAIAPLLDAGLEVHAVDVPEMAQRNLASLAGPGEGSCAVASFDDESCLLTVQSGADLAFARRIQINGMALEAGLETDHTVKYLAERVGGHVQRSIDLFERQSGLPAVARILIAPHRHEATFVQQLAARTAVPTAALAPLELLDCAAEARSKGIEWHPESLVALGAALRSGDVHGQSGGRAALPLLSRWRGRLGRRTGKRDGTAGGTARAAV